MQYSNRWRLVASIIVSLQLTACQQKPEAPANLEPSSRIEYSGQAVHRVRLTAKRAEELGIKTFPVREEQISGTLCKVVPVAAVIHDQDNTWAFTNPDPLVFVRERISVDTIDGDLAILSDGPPVGAAVVTAGAAELFSDEFDKIRVAEGDEGKRASGTATMLENGNIKVVHRAVGTSGLTASVVIEYKPQDEEYQKIIDQVGGLKVGETKSVPPSPEM